MMELSERQLDEIIHNCLYCHVDGEGVHMNRFSEGQRRFYEAASDDYGARARSSAGMTLDFITDSNVLGLKVKAASGRSWDMVLFDLLIDGLLCEHQRCDMLERDTYAFRLPEGEHRVTLFFPWCVEITLTRVILSDGASLKPAPEKKLRILVLGDSISQGYISEHPSLCYTNILSQRLDAELLNQAVGGFMFSAGSLTDDFSWNPDLIIAAYGGNDYAYNEDRNVFRTSAQRYMDRLAVKFPAVPVLAITPIFRGDDRAAARNLVRDYTLDDADAILKEVYAACPNVTVLDGLRAVPHMQDFFASDHLHPNDLGFMFYGNAVTQAVKNMMDR